IEITVMDNGIGMSKEQLEVVRNLLESDESGIRNEETWHSIGMKNVHDRIRHLYGKAYGIELTGSEGIGTSVKIRIPYEERQE
ncbi:MAG: sensor histidine kinase, partial [Vallitaleaceae bacterium]|nr:sensor histidine kinase [Vallitaleaceae bacterium]